MKIFLDDERPTPEGWVSARWPENAIRLLETGQVSHVSLDHDLGDDEHGTGYDVILWIEDGIDSETRFAVRMDAPSISLTAGDRSKVCLRQLR